MKDDHPPSACSCLLDLGCWGQGGFHFRRPTFDQLIDRAIREVIRDDPWAAKILEKDQRIGLVHPDEQERIEKAARRIRDLEKPYCKAAADKPWAYERCPRYRDTCQRQTDGRKALAREGERYDTRMR